MRVSETIDGQVKKGRRSVSAHPLMLGRRARERSRRNQSLYTKGTVDYAKLDSRSMRVPWVRWLRKPMRKATPGKVSRQRYYTRVCWKKARLSEGPRKENKPKLPHKRSPERSLKELPLLQNC